MTDELIYLNGIHAETGGYLVPPMSMAEATQEALGKTEDAGVVGFVKRIWNALNQPFRGLPMDMDPTVPDEVGWGLVCTANTPDAVRRALEPLVAHRRANMPDKLFHELQYEPGETVKDFLKRHNTYTGSVAPHKVPYYLTLVGPPTEIPFEFQCLLDIEYAVGRLDFDTPEQFAQYARSVVEYETTSKVANRREVVYWGPRHIDDHATIMSCDDLLKPMYHGCPEEEQQPVAKLEGFDSSLVTDTAATRESLLQLLHAPQSQRPPAFLFTASHGVGWPEPSEYQFRAQGGLLCADWNGVNAMRSDDYLVASLVNNEACLHGLVAFVFACYGAGTPQFDSYLGQRAAGPKTIAAEPFTAALPKRLLSHPGGGALAVIGHVDRGWGYSIRPPRVGPQLVPFRNLVQRVLCGQPVGHATCDISEKFASVSAQWLSRLDEASGSAPPSEKEFVWSWIERNDAQNYVLLGDPAVRLRVQELS